MDVLHPTRPEPATKRRNLSRYAGPFIAGMVLVATAPRIYEDGSLAE